MGSHLFELKRNFVKDFESAREAFYLYLYKETELPLTKYNQYLAD